MANEDDPGEGSYLFLGRLVARLWGCDVWLMRGAVICPSLVSIHPHVSAFARGCIREIKSRGCTALGPSTRHGDTETTA
jgi:hypothetical protein